MTGLNWRQNALTERLGLALPILQAPMGDLGTPALASAVANAGGVGGMGMMGADPARLRDRILSFRQMSAGPLNMNFVLFQPDPVAGAKSAPMRAALAPVFAALGQNLPEPGPGFAGEVGPHHLQTLAETRPEVISFHFGLPPEPVVDALKATGALLLSTATTAEEARTLEAGGCDAIIAQGLEAGGHRGTFTGAGADRQSGLMSLLPQILDAVSVPVIAAGGIADGRGIAAALTLGASAVQIGTAFLPCPESGVPDPWRVALDTAAEGGTLITDRASGKPARILANGGARLLSGIDAPTAPFPEQFGLIQALGAADSALMTVYAGQSAAMVRALPAGELMEILADETDAAFSRFG